MKIDKDYVINLYESSKYEDLNSIINAVYSLDSHNFISKEALIEIVRFQKDAIDSMNDYIDDEVNRV